MLCFGGRHGWRLSNSVCARWRTSTPHKGDYRITLCADGKAPTRHSYTVYPLLPLEAATPDSKSIISKLSSIRKKVRTTCRNPRHKGFSVISRTQVTLHATHRPPHGASRLEQAMSAWSVETRRALLRHCSRARAYDHATAAMHDMSTSPPPSPAPRWGCGD